VKVIKVKKSLFKSESESEKSEKSLFKSDSESEKSEKRKLLFFAFQFMPAPMVQE